jgi:AbiTii
MKVQYDQLIKSIEELPLSKALQKTLRVAQELKDNEFEKWIRLELHDYWNTNSALTEEVVVPEYRTVAGYYTDDYGRQLVISDPKAGFINETRLRFGVIEMEGMIGAKGPLAFRAPQFTEIIRDALGVEVTTFNFSPKTVPTALETIRTELSDRLMSRKDKLQGHDFESQESKTEDVIQLKPNIYGIGIDLKALWRKFKK